MPNGAMRMMMGRKAVAAPGGFDPISDITWKGAWWVSGPQFAAEGYSDTDEITVMPDEIAAADLTPRTTGPILNTADSTFNNQPAARFESFSASGLNGTLASTTAQDFTYVLIGRSETTDVNARAVLGSTDGAYVRTSSTSTGRLGMAAPTISVAGGDAGFNGTDTDAHLLEFYFNDASSDLRSDGALVGTTGPGTNAQSATFGINTYGDVANNGLVMTFVFTGIYEGKFSDDAAYDDFKTWAADLYGLTLA